jgi:hypothetical protein
VMYAVLPKIIAFWDVMQYILVGCNQRSWETRCLQLETDWILIASGELQWDASLSNRTLQF